jgi:hypothetical protein
MGLPECKQKIFFNHEVYEEFLDRISGFLDTDMH